MGSILKSQALLVLVIAVVVLAQLASANFLYFGADGAPFEPNRDIVFRGYVKTNAGAGVGGIKVNISDYNRTKAKFLDTNIYTDENGFFSYSLQYLREFSDTNALGDHNAVARDWNDSIDVNFSYNMSNVSSATIVYTNNSKLPPFTTTTGAVPFTISVYNSAGAKIAAATDINLELVSDTGTVQDSNNGITSGGDVNLSLTVPSTAGKYFISVNKGQAVFPFPVYSFRVYTKIINPDTNVAKAAFKTGDSGRVVVSVMNYAASQYLSGSTVTGTVYNSSHTGVASLSFTNTAGGSYEATLNTAGYANGEYTISLSIAYSGTTQTQVLRFSVQTYRMEFYAAKYSGGEMGEKEKMPSVYPTSTSMTLEAHIYEIGGSEITYSNTVCAAARFRAGFKKAGERDLNYSVSSFNVQNASTYCSISFISPTVAGTYIVELEGMDVNISNTFHDLKASTALVVQNYLVFLEPIDPETCDTTVTDVPASCGFKFDFTQGQKIGLKPTVIDMKNAASNARVWRVKAATLYGKNGATSLSVPRDLNFNTDSNKNILELYDSNTMLGLSGGFYHGEFTVDINKDGTLDQNNITAFGFFNLKVLNVTTQLVDENGTAITQHGPPIFRNDKPVYIKITVKDSDGSTALRGALVEIGRIFNFEAGQQFTVTSLDKNATNSSGIATLTIPLTFGGQTLTAGEYDIRIDINASTVNKYDTTNLFMMRRNFSVEAVPTKMRGTTCTPMSNIGGDENITFRLETEDPFSWQKLADINVVGVKLRYEGSAEKPLMEPVDINVQAFTTYKITCAGTDYNAVDINHNGTLSNGFYQALITVESTSRGRETFSAFFKVQPFMLNLAPNVPAGSTTGELVDPGTQWDFNILVNSDVNLSAKLISLKDWSLFAQNLPLYRQLDRRCVSGTGCDYNSTDINMNAGTAGRYVTIDVNISSNLPIEKDPEFGGYILQITIDSNVSDTNATEELFVFPQKWQMFPAKETMGIWMQGEPGPYKLTITGTSPTMFADSNVYNDCNAASLGARGTHMSNIDDNGLSYDRILKVNGGALGTEYDLNRFVLIDSNTYRFWVDFDDDCNWSEGMVAPDNTAMRVGQYLNIANLSDQNQWVGTNVRAYQDFSQGGQGEPPYRHNPYNGMPIVTGIQKSRLLYVTKRLTTDLNSQSVTSREPYMGQVEKDRNFGIPVIVKDLSDNPVEGVKVTVQTIMKAEFGGGMPKTLSTADYNAAFGVSDKNGLAVPIISVGKIGIMLISVKLDKNNSTQTVMPWDGIAVQVTSYSTTLTTALQDLNVRFDQNAAKIRILGGLDFNYGNIPSTCFDENKQLIGVFDEDSNAALYSGGPTNSNPGFTVDFDNDSNTSEIWYFIPLNGDVTCPYKSGSTTERAVLLVDDDRLLDTNRSDGGDTGNEFNIMNFTTIGAVNGNHNDLNELLFGSASDFPACLYGTSKCGSGQGQNPGAQYDLNSTDINLNDVNYLLVFNYFSHQSTYYEPVSTSMRKYLRLDIKNFENQYIAGTQTCSASIVSELTGQVVDTIAATPVINGRDRLQLDGNFEPGDNGRGFSVSIDCNVSGDTRDEFGFFWSSRRST